ncbi:MAG TPA: L-seryl-tRNA(Sec) selenium transferase [Longimicrobiales bacterium]|nr:L-seryl-tRNA(Sec) selenium transferase [Longimicrobiales bacterium]
MTTDPRRRIPPVEGLLVSPAFEPLRQEYGRVRVVAVLRSLQAAVRGTLSEGGPVPTDEPSWWAAEVRERLRAGDVPSLRPVINATGVVLHTNLGRAPLAAAAREAMTRAALGYDNLEMDLETGRRGSRYGHCTELLVELTGAPAALVVNNAAGALLLALNSVARGRGVVVSRGELVEIGGGFRIPEILERSEARLVEVGSTNRTRIRDYGEALESGEVAAVLKVHRSNFRMSGFTEEASLAELSALSLEAGVPLLYDLGSGLFADPAELGLPSEPRARDALAEGADLVVVSGDKLLGGPQAGVVMGRGALVSAMRSNPLCRALRVDKVTLAGLEATLRLYRDPPRALAEIPTLSMLRERPEVLRARSEELVERLAVVGVVGCAVVPHAGAVGGGTYPEVALSSWAVALPGNAGAEALAGRLRLGHPPVVGRIEGDWVLLDVRTVAREEEDALVGCVKAAWKATGP